MKLSTKFLLALITVTVLFSVAGAAAVGAGISAVKHTDSNTVTGIVAAVKEKYPDVTDDEIAAILNGSDSPRSAEDIMKKYGITADDAIALDNRKNYTAMILAGAAVPLALGVSALLVFMLFVYKKNRRERKMTSYMSKINSGIYELPLDDMTEDDSSVLCSEIYKTTVMLREKSRQAALEKVQLKDSLSDISHQLKTPLTSIMLMLDNVLDGDMSEEMRGEFLHDIRKSAEQISFLTQALLILSKLDANTIEFHKKPESVKEIFMFCMASMKAIADERGVELKSECEDIILDCDFKWISEAIKNILKNCIEHTPEGGSVVLSAKNSSLFTSITVSDNGCGIDSEDLPHIFERFYKGKNSSENSVGIGLALSKSIIEKNNGYIKAASEPGKGSTFTIRFYSVDPESKEKVL